MVISQISMGLGNQMFQYAAGRSLALHNNCSLKVDTRSYKDYTLRKFELEHFFDLQVKKATEQELQAFTFAHPLKRAWNNLFPGNTMRQLQLPYEEVQLKRALLKAYDKVFLPHTRKIYTEPEYYFDNNFFSAHTPVYLHGYWMTWKYFEKQEPAIRKDFTIKPKLVAHLEPFVQTLKAANSVGLHIRRTDFTSAKNEVVHGVLPVSYYINAMQYFTTKYSTPTFYIFSDDIQWAKENLPNEYSLQFVSESLTHSAIEDFYLMTQCRHNIIANSTFSWWAAYLNTYPQKEVVAPSNWYVTKKFDCKDVYPPAWIILN